MSPQRCADANILAGLAVASVRVRRLCTRVAASAQCVNGVRGADVKYSSTDADEGHMADTPQHHLFLPERYVRVFAVAIPSVVCLSDVCRLSVVCNVGAPYSGG